MIRPCLFFFLLLFTAWLDGPAQVVNTEKLRLVSRDTGFVGDVGLSFGLGRNKAGQTLRLGSQMRLEYLMARSRLMLLGSYDLTQFNNVDVPGSVPKNFNNRAFAHLRYNRDLTRGVAWEAFFQSQFDEIQEVDVRTLMGTGPRFTLAQNDSSALFFGVLYMYEYEETSDARVLVFDPGQNQEVEQDSLTYNRHHRLSAYLSISVALVDFFTLSHVSYVQPRLDRPDDLRIASETTLSIRMGKKFSFDAYLQLIYDTRPPMTVPRTMYTLTNGLSMRL